MSHNTREVEEIVEEFEKTWSDFIGDIEFGDAFKHLADDPDVPFVLPEICKWLRTTIHHQLEKDHHQLQKARLDEYGKGFEDGMRAAQGLHSKWDGINGLMTEIEEMADRHQDEPKPIDCYGRTIDTSFITTPLNHSKLDQDKK